ncbi:MAG: Imidazole glycerol phosphate synthase subunit HisF [Parcubacteria group bacterium GW2011_GWC2_44_17]|uniref:Imidazole glycerol phosphate synthase subunit HisF n=1 Tax=Candidatus Jacksonbacteria bacterium RIFCSPLOWO2_02_FULL_44_20 TaxID=1798460 RepID=A0A1G2A814_9BACT|nr:MAG: Imidazole glycerol phosphate synthase subunit HisF [Parcubacteria group bacterium GW2011_GWC2_44_17]KKT48315.1 MAG: Imidazole glycerol phosphate synthase subunit HisF [Parcubacteria group bacterium GW2011_GWF2_44_17]OGY70788.1 MAG: imidazole glycerol phosphate synthase subunit HisF [Candidatus Jacksonbacteria bacterium RIFCSPHIGHO2_12_FULL_44_12]OGY71651.1 MAG: imidazole glycerol phosphate synthase subunit HisF [Candidatus Jacksonbacteria bacterium RIFCSPHIGHO2_02_FULL_44_25]OGY72972.1 
MLTKRIIPCLDIKDNRITKGVQFKDHKDMGDPVERARFYYEQCADELVLYDIMASPQKRGPNFSLIERVGKRIFIPFAIAGGVRSVEDARRALNAGADKVSINTPALENPDLINKLAENFGSQCVVIGIDVKDGWVYKNTGSARETQKTKWSVIDWAKEVERRGAGEIVLNTMQTDGMRAGYDIKTCRSVAKSARIPVIASGGAGTREHFLDVFTKTEVSGALAATVFHTNAIKIPSLKKYLQKCGLPIRI